MSIFEEELKSVKECTKPEKVNAFANYADNALLYLRSKFPTI